MKMFGDDMTIIVSHEAAVINACLMKELLILALSEWIMIKWVLKEAVDCIHLVHGRAKRLASLSPD